MSSLPPPGGPGSVPPPPPPPPPPGTGGWNPTQATSCWPVPPEYSGFWRRVGARLIDGFLIGIPSNIAQRSDSVGVVLIGTAIGIGLWFWFAWMTGAKGQTPGRKATGIRVVREDGSGPIGGGAGIGREFMSLISGLVFLLGYLWMLWDKPRHQTWHDKVVHSVVVRA